MGQRYYIGDIVKELKINKETVRYYEKIGLLSGPKKDDNGYRIYSKEDIEKLTFIIIVKGLGFSLNEISMLINDNILSTDVKEISNIVNKKVDEINNKIDELEEKKKVLCKLNKIIDDENLGKCDKVKKYLEEKS